MPLPRFATSSVKRRLLGGSSAPVVVETPGGPFVMKLRGAGHGVKALISEIIVAELAERVDLSVPERVLIDLLPGFQSEDRNDELAGVLERSVGLNVGVRWLDGAQDAGPEYLAALPDEYAMRLLWLDGLCMNPDRTRENPNILVWKAEPWLIDHGSALPFHHDWRRLTEDAPNEPHDYTRHVFGRRAALLPEFDARLVERFDRASLEAALAKVPDELLGSDETEPPSRQRALYQAFLWKRLKAPRAFCFPGQG